MHRSLVSKSIDFRGSALWADGTANIEHLEGWTNLSVLEKFHESQQGCPLVSKKVWEEMMSEGQVEVECVSPSKPR